MASEGPSLFLNVSSLTLQLIKRLANPNETLKAGLRFPPLWDLTRTAMRHTTWSSEGVGFGQARTPESKAKLDTGGVERHCPFRSWVQNVFQTRASKGLTNLAKEIGQDVALRSHQTRAREGFAPARSPKTGVPGRF